MMGGTACHRRRYCDDERVRVTEMICLATYLVVSPDSWIKVLAKQKMDCFAYMKDLFRARTY